MKTCISPSLFGKDHWSLLAYIECRCVDDRGALDKRHLRCNPTGPHRIHAVNARLIGAQWEPTWGTRIKGGQLDQHDDWCCLDDLEAAGYVEVVSTANGVVKLTKGGVAMAALLRAHKAAGGQFATFNPAAAHS